MTIQVVNPLDIPDWDELILSFPEYSFFHTTYWAKVLSGYYNYRPLYFTRQDEGRITAIVPIMEVNSRLTGKRAVSLPFTDSCEPLKKAQVNFDEVFEQIKREGEKRGWKYIELRGGDNLLGPVPAFQIFFGHSLNLESGEKEVIAGFRNSTKRNMKKALQSGVTITIGKSLEAMVSYYRLHTRTRKRHGLPPQPFGFFETVFYQVMAQGKGIVILASYNQKVIAGAVFLFFGNKIIYKFGASDFNYQELRANNLIMGEAIRWACRGGFKHFDFGRTEADNQGLRQFKSGWGTKEREIKYFRYNFSRKAFVPGSSNANSSLSHLVFKTLPEPVLTLLGRVFYRHMG
jgi:lipid II:glycine glycyltransferase (peptidoglycan interpeptide bridge formation enzyme)